jgi:hypothetical protein
MKNLKYALSFSALMLVVAIGSQSCYYDKYEDLHPTDTTANACDTSNVTYSGTLKAIIDANCANQCHNTSYNQMPYLTTFDECKNGVEFSGVIDRIDRQSGDGLLMPPTGRMNECNITLFKVWKSQGYKQ